MRGAYYRTGQAARRWGTTSHIVRRLCEAGLVEAELSDREQWRIPASEIERIEREGIPEIPSATAPSDEDEIEAEGSDDCSPHHLLVRPSEKVVTSSEDVLVAKNRLERLRVERETEETRDWFRGRERTDAEAEAREDEAERTKNAHEQAQLSRSQWFDERTADALSLLPDDAPPEVRLDVRGRLAKVLEGLGPLNSPAVVFQLLAAVVQQVQQPWSESRETTQAIEAACNDLPFETRSLGTPTTWQTRAYDMAAAAVRKLPSGCGYDHKLRAAKSAVEPVIAEFEDCQVRKRIPQQTQLWDVGLDDRENARAAIQEALDAMPRGTSEIALRRAVEKALDPFHEKRRQQERSAEEQRRAEMALDRIGSYLDELYRAGETGFDNFFELLKFAERVRDRLRKEVLKRMKREDLSDDELEAMVEELVEKELG
jgi:hypothetical protein